MVTQAISLDGLESLIEHRASVEDPDTKTYPNLIRVSVELENSEDLMHEFRSANAIKKTGNLKFPVRSNLLYKNLFISA